VSATVSFDGKKLQSFLLARLKTKRARLAASPETKLNTVSAMLISLYFHFTDVVEMIGQVSDEGFRS